MSTRGVHRQPRSETFYPQLDLTLPIDTDQLMTAAGDCFGIELDITHQDCIHCADNEICSIKFAALLRSRVKEKEKIVQYLDTSDWTLVDEEKVNIWLSLKQRTTEELLDKVLALAKSPDDQAGINWIKKFMPKYGWKSKGGILYDE